MYNCVKSVYFHIKFSVFVFCFSFPLYEHVMDNAVWSLYPSLVLSFFSSLSLTSRLVKTLLYNFIRQEKCPPPATHIFEPKDEGGLLYGLASGVASMCNHIHTHKFRKTRAAASSLGKLFVSAPRTFPRLRSYSSRSQDQRRDRLWDQ